MNNKKNTPFDGFDWSDMQKKYIDALAAFNAPGATTDSGWVNAMNDWWQSNKPEAPNENLKMFENVLEQFRNYYYLGEQFSNLIDGINGLKGNTESITDFINAAFKKIDPVFFDTNNNFGWHKVADNYDQLIKLLQSAPLNASVFKSGILKESSASMGAMADHLFSVASLGVNRGTQDKYKEAIKLWAKYQDNYQEDMVVKMRLSQEALALMRLRMLEMSKQGTHINSLREIYNLWVECNEKIYGEYVFTEEYADLSARLVNSMMAFKKQSHKIIEEALVAMNMPTTSAMNDLERRHYALRKQVKALHLEINNLKKELLQKSDNPPAEKSNSKPAGIKKKTKASKRVVSKPVTKVQKSRKKSASSAVNIPKSKKKIARISVAKKKIKRRTKKQSADKGMIKLKF